MTTATAFALNHYHSLVSHGQYAAAFRLLQPAVAQDPTNPALLEMAADCYWHLGKERTSVEILQTIVNQWPARQSAALRLGARLGVLGESAQAVDVFSAILKRDPTCGPALVYICGRIKPAPASPERTALEQLAQDPTAGPALAASACHQLGELADTPQDAFDWWTRANQRQGGTYSAAEMEARVASQKAVFRHAPTQAPVAAAGHPRMLFITGLPRSGTTLLENMFNRHPAVQSLGESPALMKTRAECHKRMDPMSQHQTSWDWVRKMKDCDLARAQDAYWSKLPSPATDCPVLIDKMPGNCLELGFAKMILPDARAVFMLRHPLDIGLSLFKTQLGHGYAFSRRLDWIAHRIRATYDSLDDYIETLGPDLRLQSFSALVRNPEQQMRHILRHAGLDWHPDCLRPEDTDRAILTASSQQVREGINRKGLGKWTRYKAQLAPLIDALGGWGWIHDWEARDAALQDK